MLDDRIKRALAYRKSIAAPGEDVSQTALAQFVGIKPPSVNAWFSGGTKSLKGTSLVKAANYLRVNPEWLSTGIGRMIPEQSGSTDVAPAVVDAQDEAPPTGYIRLEHLSPQPSMGNGSELDAPVYIVQYLDVLEDWVRRKIGATDPKRIKVLTGIGRSMSPTIEHEDLVFVDTGCNTIDHPDIYVLSVGPRLLLKRALIIVGEKVLVLKSDNEAEFPDAERIPLAQADSVAVAGRVKAWWTLRR